MAWDDSSMATQVRERTHSSVALRPPRFEGHDGFRHALRQRVDEYFAETGRRRRGCPALHVKTAIVFGCLVTSYTLLVFAPVAWWMAIPLTVVLGLSLAAAGFNVPHDGGHGAYSNRRWINKVAVMTLDLLGASSYVWLRKHNSIHHSYTNITGHDHDINVGILGRLSPHQQRLWFHRVQHVYMWILYGLMPIHWHVYEDFHQVLTGRIGGHRLVRPKGRDLITFLGGKALFFTLALGIPMLLHPWWLVLSVYAAATFVQGVVLSVVFQLAHCVEEAEFPLPNTDTGRMATTWAEHQVQTTINFAPRNRLLTWYVGGLNFQIEHHLFPQICHVHYPALAPLVQKTCREFGLTYVAKPTLRASIASHFRWLRRMGRAVRAADESSASGEVSLT
jgi:linoleoyl-CoA desaturase